MKFRSGRAAIAAAFGLAAVVTASAPAASPVDPLYGTFPAPTASDLAGFPATDGPGTNAGLSPRLSAIASGLSTESKAAQSDELSLRANGPGSLERDGNRYVVTARVDPFTSATVDDLRAAGAEIISVNREYGTVDLSAAAADLIAIARVPGIKAVTEALAPLVGHVASPATADLKSSASKPASFPCQGVNVSEGDQQMQAAAARAQFGVTGAGQKVGIISDSFDVGAQSATRAAQDIASGDLPGPANPCNPDPVQVIAEGNPQSGEDEGRGMAQIVHDIAPGAEIAFSTDGVSADQMAGAVTNLQTAGSSVIVDDITFFDEPFFQEGSVSQAVDTVTAAGVPYYSSAANSNVIVNGADVGSYETSAFRSAGDCLGYGGTCADFSPNGAGDYTYGLALNGGSQMQVNFQWAQPRNGVTTNLDIFAYDATLGQFVAQAVDNNVTTQKPFELLNVQNSDSSPHIYYLTVYRAPGSPGTPRFKFILGRPQLAAAEYTASTGPNIIGPTIFGHNGAANAVSTAAIPYDNAAVPETYSSRGPLAYYFGPVSGNTAAAALATPQVLNKPDLAATDNVQTTFFIDNSSGVYRFGGTSAAAPHGAAVAALQRQANPFLNVGQVVGAQTATAAPVGGFNHNAVGAGLINASAAVGANPPLAPQTTIDKDPKKHVTTKAVTYKFSADLPGVSFVCKIDKSKPQPCASPVRVTHLDYGKHKFQVIGFNGSAADASPAKDKFKRVSKRGRHP